MNSNLINMLGDSMLDQFVDPKKMGKLYVGPKSFT